LAQAGRIAGESTATDSALGPSCASRTPNQLDFKELGQYFVTVFVVVNDQDAA